MNNNLFTIRRVKPYIPQLFSTVLIIYVILIAKSNINLYYEVSFYLICFLLNIKIIEFSIKGNKRYISKEQYNKKQQEIESIIKSTPIDPELYNTVKQYVIDNQKVSESMIQRVFNVSYNTARIMVDMLEKEGIVSCAIDTKPRTVLVRKEEIK